jgi:hypothetical protein
MSGGPTDFGVIQSSGTARLSGILDLTSKRRSVDLAVDVPDRLRPTYSSPLTNCQLAPTIFPRLIERCNLHRFDNMAHNHRNAHRLTDQVGEVSANIQQALENRLAELKQLLKMNPALPSTEASHVAYDVRVSIIASEQGPIAFPGCFPKSSSI